MTELNNSISFDEHFLSDEQRIVFMEVVAESLQINQQVQLFKWLQGCFQFLLGHEVMVFAYKNHDDSRYEFEYLTSSRYFNEARFKEATQESTGMIHRAISAWKNSTVPLFATNTLETGIYNQFAILHVDEDELKASELHNLIVHGFGDHNSIVIFGRLHKKPSAEIAKLLEMLVPHLHSTLINVLNGKIKTLQPSLPKKAKKLSGRESQVVQWLCLGKTNWEISTILDISPLTVKNHVQNIIKKLDVQNRRQAATKAAKLGLVKQQA